MPDSDESDDDVDGGLTSDAEVQELTVGLNQVLYNFLTFLDHFSLKRSSESMEVAIQQLIDLTHMETSKFIHHTGTVIDEQQWNVKFWRSRLCNSAKG